MFPFVTFLNYKKKKKTQPMNYMWTTGHDIFRPEIKTIYFLIGSCSLDLHRLLLAQNLSDGTIYKAHKHKFSLIPSKGYLLLTESQ